MDEFILRILLFLMGLVLAGIGGKLAFSSLESHRGAFQLAIVGTCLIIIGLYFLAWAVIGPPS